LNIELIHKSLLSLKAYIEKEDYKGWDPYDGLNSKVFQALPLLKNWDLARLAWIQLFKRNPVNFRRLFLITKEYNPKGIALLLSGYCNLLKYHRLKGDTSFGNEPDLLHKIIFLADLLINLRSPLNTHDSTLTTHHSPLSTHYSPLTTHYSSWGYNFDWQARRLFLFPKNTPTVVATSFAADALFTAYETTKDERYLNIALSSANFILNDLCRTQVSEGFLFSYSQLKGNDTVYNASLLGTRLLSQCYSFTGDKNQLEKAKESASACAKAQNGDGSWYYGGLDVQKWIDSFHTGYNLEAFYTFQKMTGDGSFNNTFEKGFGYYVRNFFLNSGTPKYFHNKTYPVDIHCPAQLIVTLCRTGKIEQHNDLAEKVLAWTVSNMQDSSGYFYYQKSRLYTNRISYMRWSNAFMFNALSLYLLAKEGK